ncbi:substrate-specific component FolT of folate ECF transporter [Mesomycoplasma conjunctivae]
MKRWNSMQISFVAIFISISVIMLIIGTRLAPFAIIPTFRLAIIGLPIKITGFIFGPIVGLLTGFLSDIITFLFVPGVYSWYYTVYISITGFIPGVFFWLFVKKGKQWFEKENLIERFSKKITSLQANFIISQDDKSRIKIKENINNLENKIKKIQAWNEEKYLLNFYWIISNIILVAILAIIISVVFFSPNINFEHNRFIKNKTSFVILILFGTTSMIVFIFIARFLKFFIKKDRYLTIVPIVAFSAVHEPIASIIASLGDVQSGALANFETALVSHLITSPIKIWVNLSIIYFTARAVVPLVHKKISYSL